MFTDAVTRTLALPSVIAKVSHRRGHNRLRLLRTGLAAAMLAVAVTISGMPHPAAAASYLGPFQTTVETGAAICYSHSDFGMGTRIQGDLILGSPKVVSTGAPKFAAIKRTIQIYSIPLGGSTWTRWPDRVVWGTPNFAVNRTTINWLFNQPWQAITQGWHGFVVVADKFEFTDAAGRTLPGGTYGPVTEDLATQIYKYSPSTNTFQAGYCLF